MECILGFQKNLKIEKIKIDIVISVFLYYSPLLYFEKGSQIFVCEFVGLCLIYILLLPRDRMTVALSNSCGISYLSSITTFVSLNMLKEIYIYLRYQAYNWIRQTRVSST